MREHCGKIYEMAMEVLLCLFVFCFLFVFVFLQYPCCDLFHRHIEEVWGSALRTCKDSAIYWEWIGLLG